MGGVLHLEDPDEGGDEKNDAEYEFENGYDRIGIAELEL